MKAAIHYIPEAYTLGGPVLRGRNASGASFLRGYVAWSRAEEFWALTGNQADTQQFTAALRAQGRNEPVHGVHRGNPAELRKPGLLYNPDPRIGSFAWQRARYGHGAWSLCGITHTISSSGAMDALTELLTAPVQPWDAVICTSTAVRDAVTRILRAQADYLADRLGIARVVLPQLPVIPLGIHTGDFAFGAAARQTARTVLEAGPDTLVVLFVGRLSFHSKAHPLAMYQALEHAANASGKDVLLVECGRHANEHIGRAFEAAAQLACPHVRTMTLDGSDDAAMQHAWAGADVFCSLSDNFQESFGLTPVEAMAAGLPLVVSDWDGYRDTVRHGEDGFLVPTTMPAPGLGNDLAQRYALGSDTYDVYCGNTSMLVAVDIPAAAEAFVALFTDPGLRARMGAAGRQRARATYDWAQIIPRYEELWGQLAELRQAQGAQPPLPAHPWPARIDPFHAFAAYPTHTLTPKTQLSLNDTDAATAHARLQAWLNLAMVNFAKALQPPPEDIRVLIAAAAKGPRAAAELVAGIPRARQPQAYRMLAWLLKLGILTLHP